MVSLHWRLKITLFWHVFFFIYPARCRGIPSKYKLCISRQYLSHKFHLSLLYAIFSAGALAYDQCLFSTCQKPTEYRKLSCCLFEFEGTSSSEEYCFVSRFLGLNDAGRSLYFAFFIACFVKLRLFATCWIRYSVVSSSILSNIRGRREFSDAVPNFALCVENRDNLFNGHLKLAF